jgi:hypothetical protein
MQSSPLPSIVFDINRRESGKKPTVQLSTRFNRPKLTTPFLLSLLFHHFPLALLLLVYILAAIFILQSSWNSNLAA